MNACVGVDVSKHHLDWVVGGEGKVERVPNTPAGVRRLVARLRRREVGRIAVESTGGYERALVVALAEAELPVVLVNPWRVRRFGEGLGVLAKTDPIDARILALFGERARPAPRPPPTPRQRQLADWIRRRRQLIAMIVAEKGRLDTDSAVIRREIRDLVKLLERRVVKIDEQIDAAIADDPEKAEKWERRLIAAGKPPELAFIALARKLLTILNAMVRDRTTWPQATR